MKRFALQRVMLLTLNCLGLDGIAAFVHGGFTASDASYRDLEEKKPEKVQIVHYRYNTKEHPMPQLSEYNVIVCAALDELAKNDVRIVVMPPINGEGGTSEDKINALEQGVASWLNANPECSIQKVYIATF